MLKLQWTTEKRKVDDLVPYVKNPRTITDTEKEKLKRSLEKFGVVEIPAINKDNTIIAGHQRLKIMKLLGRGQDEIDLRVPSRQLTEQEFQQYLLTSNRSAGQWDWEILSEFKKDLLWEVGFESKEIDKVFKKKEIKEDDFDVDTEYKKTGKPESVFGEVYELGNHRVMCGNACDPEHVDKLMNGKVADMVFTDPPYNVNYQGPMNTHTQTKREKIENDNMDEEKFQEFIGQALANMLRVTKGCFYVCMSSKELWSIKQVFERGGGALAKFYYLG